MPRCEFCREWTKTPAGLKSHKKQSESCLRIQAGLRAAAARRAAVLQSQPIDVPGSQPEDDYHRMDVDPPVQAPLADRRARVEEVEDETTNDPISFYDPLYVHMEHYPEGARAGATTGKAPTGAFESHFNRLKAAGEAPWAPWASIDEWDLARWLMTSGLSQGKIDEFVHLKSVREGIAPSFKTARAFIQKVDALPRGPAWHCTPHTISSDELDGDGQPKNVEVVELWHRDILECVAALLGNPAFATEQAYKPIRLFRNANRTNREYDEMWTSTWWWDTQKKGELGQGATIVPIILSSDKTQLSSFSGDKQAWPVYITIGNISKSIRRQPSAHATMLLGYIPVAKLDKLGFSKARKQFRGYQVFHDCMRQIVEPLVKAGTKGVEMACADGWLRKSFPILAAEVMDYPEQCLVCCCQENTCPRCTCPPNERGSAKEFPLRTQAETLRVMSEASNNLSSEEFRELNLRPVKPFWADLPHTDIHSCITPDLLHQMNKGVFGDHFVNWTTEAMGGSEESRKKELDSRFRTLPRHPTLRHFSNGTSVIKQWTGSEYRSLSKIYLGVVQDAVDPDAVAAMRHLLDFMSYAHFQVHTDESLEAMEESLRCVHQYLPVYERLGIRDEFNISKFHNIHHTIDSIRSRGTCDGFNTENTERLHIDLAKNGYRASNRRDYTRQMTRWLTRQEAVHHFSRYLAAAVRGYQPGEGYVPSAAAMAERVEDSEEDEDEAGLDEEDPEEISTKITYTIASRPAHKNFDAETIETRFQIRDFLYYLQEFMDKNDLSQQMPLLASTGFDVFKQATLHLPELRAAPMAASDVVHAALGQAGSMSNQGIKRATPAKFSTVLVRVGERNWQQGPLSGLRAAQIKLIFRLPEAIQKYEHPLVYLHWFTPFRTDPALDFATPAGFSRITHSTSQGQRRSEIRSLADIEQTCHLIPQFSLPVNPDWTSETVLNQAAAFYFHPYLRHRDFVFYRFNTYLVERYKTQKAQELARALARGANRIQF
ncbi:hypothetical protein HMN09_01403100 [Mycena chlorophos]|uniref:Uncharacterized protein n=1 Tax=Mycena chlorophos TaxID=658473 RepID=A0A8H6RVZ1_MYCCL|nr:hypothetical protein HMN09_01403100 [Mycena chlorophos]